jgi:hypothetical protein
MPYKRVARGNGRQAHPRTLTEITCEYDSTTNTI